MGILGLVAFFGLMIGIVALASRLAHREEAKRICEWVDRECDDETFSAPERFWGEGKVDGVSFTFSYSPNRKEDNQDSFVLSVDSPTGKVFEIRREADCDRRMKQSGFTKEVQTGDEEFDKRCYLSSDDPAFLSDIMLSAPRRAAVMELLDCGFTTIYHNGRSLRAQMLPFFEQTRTRSRSPIGQAVPAMAAIAEGLPCDEDARRGKVSRPWSVRMHIPLMVFPIVLGCVGVACIFVNAQQMDLWKFFCASLLVSLPLSAGYIWRASKILRGRSRSHKQLTNVAYAAVYGFMSFVFFGGIFLNQRLDEQESFVHMASVIEKVKNEGDAATSDYDTFHLRIPSWRPGNENFKLKVDVDFFEDVPGSGSRLKVLLKPGAFGFEWISGYDFADE